MRKRHDAQIVKCIRWMIQQHDDGQEWIPMVAIYEAWNKVFDKRRGVTSHALSNFIGKDKRFDKGPMTTIVYDHSTTAQGTTWCVKHNYRDEYRIRRETEV